jgi:predicted acylesterase/phospholipase RssA
MPGPPAVSMYDCLVMSAGGTYGAAYVGAVRALEARGMMRKIRRIHGTSAGSLVAAMAACGLGSDRMLEVMETVCTEPRPSLDLRRLTRHFGVSDVDVFLKSALDSFVPPEATFASLAKTSGINLSVHAYCVTDRKLVDFGLDATPDALVRDAVAASCCVPFLFAPVTIDGKKYVDGAVAQRTPMHMIVNPADTLVLDVCSSDRGDPHDVLEFMTVLMTAASRHIGPFTGDFVTIAVPKGTPSLTDLPVPRKSIAPLLKAGYEAAIAAIEARAAKSAP